MKNVLIAGLFLAALLVQIEVFAKKANKVPTIVAYISLLDSQNLKTVRINIERSYDADGKIKKAEMKLGDGKTVVNELDYVHTYVNNGIYNIQIKVWDDENAETTFTKVIEINDLFQYQTQSIPIYNNLEIKKNKEYKFNISDNDTDKIYEVILYKHESDKKRKNKIYRKKCVLSHFNQHKKKGFIYLNEVPIFNESEIEDLGDEEFLTRYVSLEQANKLIAKGLPLKKDDLEIYVYPVLVFKDRVAPTLSLDIDSNTITNRSQFTVNVQDSSSTVTNVWKNNVFMFSSDLTEFDVLLTEGINNFSFQSTDAFGNQSEPVFLNDVTTDTARPLLYSNVQPTLFYSSFPQHFTLTITANEDLQYLSVNGSVMQMVGPNTYQYLFTVTEAQTVHFQVLGIDIAGNEVMTMFSQNFSFDILPPVVTPSITANTATNSTAFQITVSDNADFLTKVYINDQLTLTTTDADINVNLQEGINNITIISTDSFGNSTGQINIFGVVVDTIAPSVVDAGSQTILFSQFPIVKDIIIQTSEPAQKVLVNSQLATKIDDTHFKVALTINANGSYDLADFRHNTRFENLFKVFFGNKAFAQTTNSFSLSVVVVDLVGNQGFSTLTYQYINDTVPPAVTTNLLSSYEFDSLPNTIELQFQGSEALASAKVSGQQVLLLSPTNFNFVLAVTNVGFNAVSVEVVDLAGNTATYQFTFNVDEKFRIYFVQPGSLVSTSAVNVLIRSTKPLDAMILNGQYITVADDGLSATATLQFPLDGSVQLQARGLAGQLESVVPLQFEVNRSDISPWNYQECAVGE